MRFLPGAIATLVIALGIAWARFSSDKEPKPPESFLDAELAVGDAAHTGSCYSLRVVLHQHVFMTPGAVASWQPIGTEDWMFRLEWVENAGAGPVSAWETMTFRKLNDQVYAEVIDTSRGNTAVEPFIKDLVSYPQERHATKVARCLSAMNTKI